MLYRLRRLFAPPIFENEEKTRVAGFMINFSWIAIGVVAFLAAIRLFTSTDVTAIPQWVLVAVVFLLFITQYLVRRGSVEFAGFFVILGLWSLMTFLAWSADGLRDLAVIAYIVIILLSSLLFRGRFTFSVGLLSVSTIWLFALMETSGLRSAHYDRPISYARDLTGIFALIGVLNYLLVNGWSRSLSAARLELRERLRAEEKLQQQAAYLTALHETALGLLNRRELSPLLESILARGCELLGTEHGLIDLVLPDESALRQEIGNGVLSRFNGALTLRAQGVTGNVWITGESLVVDDYAGWEKAIPEFVSSGFRTVMGVPLKLADRVIGVLAIAYVESDRFFTIDQVKLMERYAALAALAIDNARLNERAQNELIERRNIELALRNSEERFRKVFLTSPVAICITTLKDGILLDANEGYWDLSGLDPKVAIGRNPFELDIWPSTARREEFVQRLKMERSIHDPDYKFHNNRHEVRSVLAFYELFELNGRECILSMFYDVTAQRQAEAALRESEARTRALLNAVPDLIFEISKDGVFLEYLPSPEIVPMISPEEFIGRKVSDFFPSHISGQTLFAISRAVESGQVQAFEYGLPPGEEVQFFEARVSPVSQESVMVMVRDISQRKWIETEREKLIDELENKNAELERFTYVVSHDLKSPLITIRGFLGFVEQDAFSRNMERLRHDIKRISDATDKMQKLLQELLELSRVGRLMNPAEYIPFGEVVNEALEIVQGRLMESHAQVHVQGSLPMVYGDRRRLVEVIQNLVDNAAKFSSNRSDPQIEIGHAGTKEGMPVFYVKDNGIGIAPEHFDRIFGLFNKLDIDTDGTGIGLALVKRIVEVHRGRIWVQSEAGRETIFYFTLQTGPAS